MISLWINKELHLEGTFRSIKDTEVNGIVVGCHLHEHGGSLGITLNSSIIRSLGQKNKRVSRFKIYLNQHENIEFEPF
jgi:hypothetical protein